MLFKKLYLFLFVFSLYPTIANADGCSSSSNYCNGTVDSFANYVSTTSSGDFRFRILDTEIGNLSCAANTSKVIYIESDHVMFKEMVTLTLTAIASGKSITLYYNEDTDPCTVSHINLNL
jgi:hypothetical protein